MTMMTSPRSYRGIAAVRADASDPNKILADLQIAVKAMRDKNDEALKAKVDDVVLREHVDRINASVGAIQAAVDEANARIAAMAVNGDGAKKVRDPDYNKAFATHMKRGDVQASLNKGAASEGGFLAPVEWDRTIADKLVIISPMRQLATVQTIGTAGFSKLFNQKGTASGWVGETAARPETATAAFGSLTYDTGELYANPAATQQMLDDAEVDLESWLAGDVEQEFALQEGTAFVAGNGANGRPKGLTTYVTGAANATAHPYGAITLTPSGHASQLTADGIVNLTFALPQEFTGNARFAMNRDTHRLVRLLKDGQGNYLWQPSYQAGSPATLNGYPVTEMAGLANVAANAIPIFFGDFARSYLVIDRVGTRVRP